MHIVRIWFFISFAFFSNFFWSQNSAVAADVRPYIGTSGSYRAVIIEGRIEEGDYDVFIKIIKENHGKISGVYIFSSGGDFIESIKIGRAMRELELSSTVPMKDYSGYPVCDASSEIFPRNPANCACSSSCFFIHIGAVFRAGTYLAAHRPYFSTRKFGELSEEDAKKIFKYLQDEARIYMLEMGVPTHVQEDILGTPSDKVLILDDKTIRTYFLGALPDRYEWEKSRCSVLTDSERMRKDEYGRKLLSVRNPSDAGLSQSEWNDISSLQKKMDQEIDCKVKVGEERREEAYEEFFNINISDVQGRNFKEWPNAINYMGRNFYEITSEEKFREEELGSLIYLKKDVTAVSPSIILAGGNRRRVVSSVAVFSPVDPSRNYIKSVVDALTEAYGRPSVGDQNETWRWKYKNLRLLLERRNSSTWGVSLMLTIEPE